MAAVAPLLALLACSSRPQAPGEAVLLVSWDTVGAAHLALYGEGAATPNLAALAARGARWSAAITHFPETSWSHWSLMTGVEPALHGQIPAARDSTWTGPTVAERYRARGWATAAFVGGVTLERALTGLDRGFDLYDDGGDPRAEPKRPAAEVTDRALAWMRGQQGSFFAFVHYFDAHFPYEPAGTCDPGYTGAITGSAEALRPYQGEAPPAPVLAEADLRHVVALYRCEIEALDRELGRLLAGLPEDARVVVLSDHGESFGDGYYFNHRASLSDEVLRVPLVVAPPPEGSPEGTVFDTQVGLAAVPEILEGELPEPWPVVATATDPWEGPGLLSLRAGADKAVWRLKPCALGRAEGGPIAVYRDDVPQPGVDLPSSLLGALADWEARVRALEPRTRALPPAPRPESLPPGALEALGYREPSGTSPEGCAP